MNPSPYPKRGLLAGEFAFRLDTLVLRLNGAKPTGSALMAGSLFPTGNGANQTP